MAEKEPTLRGLNAMVGSIQQQMQGIEERIQAIGGACEALQESRVADAEAIGQQFREIGRALEAMEISRGGEMERIWTALRAMAGLDGIARGMGDVCELLAPLRLLVPPTTAEPLAPGVPEALQRIRAALGFLPRRDTNFQSVTTDWDDGLVRYIGEVPRPDPRDPDPYGERVA